MTTPDTKMLSAERRNPGSQSLGPSRYIEVDREQYDALTARVAELEKERDEVWAGSRASAWVVERWQNSTLEYWTARSDYPWSSKIEEARRLAREEDAQVVLSWLLNGGGKVSEHIWVDMPIHECGKAHATESTYPTWAENRIRELESELAAARAPVEESEIAASAESLRLRLSSRARTRVEEYAEACEAMKDTRALASDLRTLLILESRLAPAADLITRLARERDEARTLLTTCADAFCDAAQLIDGHKGDDWSNWDEQARSKITNCLSSIRALKDKGDA